MPRPPRIDLPGVPIFFADADRLRYLTDLNKIALRFGCQVHAYVLMTNPVHLLATPTDCGQIVHGM